MAQQLRDDIKLLSEVQDFDTTIRKLEKQKNDIPPEIIDLRRKIAQIEGEIAEIEKESEELRNERRQKEMELDEKIEALDKYRAQKNQIKTNEAYSALLKEIQDMEKEKADLEDGIFSFMERREELSNLIKDKKECLAKHRGNLVHLEEKNNKRIEQLEKEFSEQTDKRNSIASRVDVKLVSRYEKIRKAKDGLAFVAVKNNTCHGCFIELPPQVVSELMKGDKIVSCERCSRLLYWEGE